MNLFHVTLERNAYQIRARGVDPKFSTGRMEVSWWVDEERTIWALAHVSAKRGVPVDKLIVFNTLSEDGNFVRWSRPGIFYSLVVIHPDLLYGWERFVKPEV